MTVRIVDHLEQLATEILAGYGPALAQLHEWTGGHPAAVIGASAPTGTSTPEPENDSRIDVAQTTIDRMRHLLARLADNGRTMWADIDGRAIPEPADRDTARLAIVMWTVRRTQRDPHAIPPNQLDTYARQLRQLANLCHHHQPPNRPAIIDACHAHKNANLDTPIDPHYRRWHLCRWCGDFRTLHHTNPPAKLVRLHDRGIRMTTALLRNAGIKT